MKAHLIPASDLPPEPSPPHVLSKTSAHLLLTKSPYHARLRKLRELPDETTKDMEQGTLVHAMLLGEGKKYAVAEWAPDDDLGNQLAASVEPGNEIPPPKGRGKKPKAPPKPKDPPPMGPGPEPRPEWQDWKRGDAQAAKRKIIAAGMIPLLPKHARMLKASVRKIQMQLDALGIRFEGQSEVAARWTEQTSDGQDEVECWGAFDHLIIRPNGATIYDLKIERSAHPDKIRRSLYDFGSDIQAAAYTRALEAARPELAGRVRFVFVFCEPTSGVVTPITLAGDFEALGNARWQRAIDTWARCLRQERWPAYTSEVVTISAPDWAMAAEQTASMDPYDLARYVDLARQGEAGRDDQTAYGPTDFSDTDDPDAAGYLDPDYNVSEPLGTDTEGDDDE